MVTTLTGSAAERDIVVMSIVPSNTRVVPTAGEASCLVCLEYRRGLLQPDRPAAGQ
ncbi:hypothetical protein [Rhodococcus ruber]|uniref:hypothetical protein n=1 Tax=Rhodococcus ruber TaxID=1830 RepID=UPI000347F49F|nr:hypothetical protein [Rhodococcus ruber]